MCRNIRTLIIENLIRTLKSEYNVIYEKSCITTTYANKHPEMHSFKFRDHKYCGLFEWKREPMKTVSVDG